MFFKAINESYREQKQKVTSVGPCSRLATGYQGEDENTNHQEQFRHFRDGNRLADCFEVWWKDVKLPWLPRFLLFAKAQFYHLNAQAHIISVWHIGSETQQSTILQIGELKAQFVRQFGGIGGRVSRHPKVGNPYK